MMVVACKAEAVDSLNRQRRGPERSVRFTKRSFTSAMTVRNFLRAERLSWRWLFYLREEGSRQVNIQAVTAGQLRQQGDRIHRERQKIVL